MVRVKNWIGGENEGAEVAGCLSGAGFAYNVVILGASAISAAIICSRPHGKSKPISQLQAFICCGEHCPRLAFMIKAGKKICFPYELKVKNEKVQTV